MAKYEVMLILDSGMESQLLDEELDKVKAFVESNSGSMHSVERVGRKRLAYGIGDHSEGYYAVLHLEADPTQIAPLQRNLRLNENVLRHVVFRRERFPERPTTPSGEEARAPEEAASSGPVEPKAAEPAPEAAPEPDRPTEAVAEVVAEEVAEGEASGETAPADPAGEAGESKV